MPVLNEAKDLKLGTKQVSAVYLGETKVWSPVEKILSNKGQERKRGDTET